MYIRKNNVLMDFLHDSGFATVWERTTPQHFFIYESSRLYLHICRTSENISAFHIKLKISICRATVYFKTESTQHVFKYLNHFCIKYPILAFRFSTFHVTENFSEFEFSLWKFCNKYLAKSYVSSRSKCFPPRVLIPSKSLFAFWTVCIIFR